MIIANNVVPYLPADAKLHKKYVFTNLEAEQRLSNDALVYLTENVKPTYDRLVETISVLREAFELSVIGFAPRNHLVPKYRLYQVRKPCLTEFIRERASLDIMTDILRRFDWVSGPTLMTKHDFAVDEFWLGILIDVYVEFFRAGDDDRRRRNGGTELTDRWLEGATLLSGTDRQEFIWRSIGTDGDINIFRSVTEKPKDENVTYIDELNKNVEIPTKEALDLAAGEPNAKKSAALQNLTLWSYGVNWQEMPKEPLSLEMLYAKFIRVDAETAVLHDRVTTLSGELTVERNKLTKLLKLYSWLLCVWLLTALGVAIVCVLYLEKFY